MTKKTPPSLPSTDPAAAEATARSIRALLDQRRADLRATDLELIRAAFPDVVADAERFLRQQEVPYRPWEFGVMFAEGELGQLQETYAIRPARHRPSTDAVSPIADLFCEACELIFIQVMAERRQNKTEP